MDRIRPRPHRPARWLALAAACAAAGCGGSDTGSNVRAPGEPASVRTQALNAGAALLQNKPPIEAINAYLDGFHFYSGDLQSQMEAHHYCTIVNEDVTQCAIFDGNARDAKLTGVEYIVSAKLFATLPAAEKTLWHSHAYEVKSGTLIAPGIPAAAEHALMEKLVGTYGKTWHTWHTDRGDALPVGVPQLMMGFTADGQLDAGLLEARDRRLGVDSIERRAQRDDIDAPAVLPGADAWQKGHALQLRDPTQPGAPQRAKPKR